jgi:hypothetical protein
VRELLVGDRSILVLSINRRREGLAQMNDGRVLVRRGAMNTALIGDELMRFVAARSLTRYESTPVPVALRDADPALVQRLREAHGWSADTTSERLVEAGFAVLADGDVSLTVAGALYLLPRPAVVLGKGFGEVFRYRDDPDVYDRRVEIDGPVNDQVEEATKMIVDELGSDVVVIGLHRHELPRVPEPVLREAVANAVAHRFGGLATTGIFTTDPGTVNTMAHTVTFTLDLRHVQDAVLAEMVEECETEFQRICEKDSEKGCQVEWELLVEIRVPKQLQEQMEQAVKTRAAQQAAQRGNAGSSPNGSAGGGRTPEAPEGPSGA